MPLFYKISTKAPHPHRPFPQLPLTLHTRHTTIFTFKTKSSHLLLADAFNPLLFQILFNFCIVTKMSFLEVPLSGSFALRRLLLVTLSDFEINEDWNNGDDSSYLKVIECKIVVLGERDQNFINRAGSLRRSDESEGVIYLKNLVIWHLVSFARQHYS